MYLRHGGGPLVTGHYKMTSPYMNIGYSSLTGLNVIIGLFSSMAVNMPDFGRFSKNRLAGIFHIRKTVTTKNGKRSEPPYTSRSAFPLVDLLYQLLRPAIE